MFFVKTRENLTQGFEIFFEIDQNKAFLWYFKRIFWKFSQKFPKQLFFVKARENLTRGFEIILKIDQDIVFFSKKYLKIFSNISKTIGFFVQSAKIQRRVFNFFEKSPKVIHFLQFPWEIFLEIFKIFWRPGGGSATRSPYEAEPLKCSTRTEIPAAPLWTVMQEYLIAKLDDLQVEWHEEISLIFFYQSY